MSENPVFDQIKTDLESNDVVLYMKGSKNFPQCGFSSQVVQILNHVGLTDFKDINVLTDQDIRQGIKEFNDWPTIPQLFVKGEFVGGCDIITQMYQSGDLQTLLEESKVI